MITAKEFEEKKGSWNGKIYHGNVVYKNNKKYEIKDPENLTQKQSKKAKKSFNDVLSKLSNARIAMIMYLHDNKDFTDEYFTLEDDKKGYAIAKLKEEIEFLQEEVKKLEETK